MVQQQIDHRMMLHWGLVLWTRFSPFRSFYVNLFASL
jgi:hypothetical protein